MEQHESMAPGQQNYPKTEKEENNKNALSGDEIIAGAKKEDQLDEFKENAAGTQRDNAADRDTSV
jgi:hypothetical protein